MDTNALKAAIVLQGIRVADLLERLKQKHGLSLSKSAFYRKIKGKCEFDRKEILAISEELQLGSERLIAIFFNEKVS